MQVAQLRTMAELYPDEVGFWVIGEGQLTFAQWDGQANRLARGMTKLGIRHGDRVAIRLAAAHALHWVIAYAAIHKAGGVAVPLDPRLAQAEVARMFVHADVVGVVADGDRVGDAMTGAAEEGSPLELVIDASVGDRSTGRPQDPVGGRPRRVPWAEMLDDDDSAYQVP